MGSNSKGGVLILKGSSLEIKASEKKFKFEPQVVYAKPGQKIQLKIVNQLEELPIVFSLLKKGEDPVVNAFLGLQAGQKNMWRPPAEQVIFSTEKLDSTEENSMNITLPMEEGAYFYISSYPGQVDDLKGVLYVMKDEPVLDSLIKESTN